VETIYKEAQRASRITTNLLSFARRHKPEKSLISINEVIEKSLELNAYRMNVNNIEVLTELDPDLPRTMADFYQMQQLFVNIITNAEQAMTEILGQGKFSVKTQKIDEMIRITLTDDGPGISEDNMTRIFDPFFTTKDVGKGTGLGLSICFGIIQDHGGHLHAESKPGEGTAFVVELPIISEDQHNNKHADSVQPERS
jgi:signal transduction histidine kinase